MSGKNNGIIFLIIGGILALFAVTQVSSIIRNISRPAPVENADVVTIIVANEAILAGTTLSPELLAERTIPAELFNDRMYRSIEQITAVPQITTFSVTEGEFILKTYTANQLAMEQGFRAVSIGVDSEQSVGQNVRSGNFVDIVSTYSYDQENVVELLSDIRNSVSDSSALYNEAFQVQFINLLNEIRENEQKHASEILLQNVQVMAVNDVLAAGDIGAAPIILDENGLPQEAGNAKSLIVTLKLTPEDAQKLLFARQYSDSLHMMLRRQDDDVIAPIQPLTEYLYPEE